jgi:hypothetical protein
MKAKWPTPLAVVIFSTIGLVILLLVLPQLGLHLFR